MGRRIGIDLGTTNSVVAILGKIGEHPRFGEVTVLADKYQRTIHASAICECDGEVLIGDDAKYRAAEGYTPHRFWKRYMGKDVPYELRGKRCLPPDLSAELLVYLKNVAETALGDTVDSAIITHPAYFGGEAIAATREAGDRAVLNVGEDGLMMEPIAAALAYLRDDPDPDKTVRVIVYDLGGGTFDITVMERASGVFRPLSFDGDPELGGYNFDKALADHILSHLRAQDYKIEIDPDNPESDSRWAMLMHVAEEAKIDLSKDGAKGAKTDIRNPRLFTDDNGKSVRLAITITRDEYEKMIEPMVEHTIECCKRALTKSKLELAQIDRAILVGGSTRTPLVQRRLEEEFKRKFELDEDMVDLCVAIGAAMYAGSEPIGPFKLESIPSRTSDDKIVVAGVVLPSDTVSDVDGSLVTVTHNSEEDMQKVGPDGQFYFEVELTQDDTIEVKLTATTPDGAQFAEHSFQVEHNTEAEDDTTENEIGEIPTYLAKTLYVDTTQGLQPIAAEGPPLPIDIQINDLRTATDQNPEVVLELFQEDQHLAEIVLKDFSAPVPKGTPIRLTVHVGKDYSMNARAELLGYGSVAEVKNIPMPPPPKPAVETLRKEHEKLQGVLKDFLMDFPDGERKMEIGGEAERITAEVTGMLGETAPDVFRIQRLLRSLDRLIKENSGDSMAPSHAEMGELFAKARSLLPEAEAKDESLRREELGKTIDLLDKQAKEAYGNRDQRAWGSIAARMNELCQTLKQIISDDGGNGGKIPDAPVLQMMLQARINELAEEAAKAGKSSDPHVQEALQQARADVDSVDLSNPNAQSQLLTAYRGPISRLEKLLASPSNRRGIEKGHKPDWLG